MLTAITRTGTVTPVGAQRWDPTHTGSPRASHTRRCTLSPPSHRNAGAPAPGFRPRADASAVLLPAILHDLPGEQSLGPTALPLPAGAPPLPAGAPPGHVNEQEVPVVLAGSLWASKQRRDPNGPGSTDIH